MRTLILIPALLVLAACGKSETPPAQSAAPQAAPAAATATAAPVETAAAAETAVATPDAVTAPTWTPPADGTTAAATPADAVANVTEAAPTPAPEAAPEPAPAQAPATAPAPAAAPEAQAATATDEAPAPAPAENVPAAASAPVAVAADAPYQVVDGRIDAKTVEGWKTYRGIGTCATCHGPVGQGGVGPALVESLKDKITKELFVETVTNGRDGTMMKPFGENAIVMENLDNIYAYLKARADGVLGPENLIKYPLGKIE